MHPPFKDDLYPKDLNAPPFLLLLYYHILPTMSIPFLRNYRNFRFFLQKQCSDKVDRSTGSTMSPLKPSHKIYTQLLSVFIFEIHIPPAISKNAARYCILNIFSPNSNAPNTHANTGSANFIINSFESSPFFTTVNQIQ